ncbi:hypothetical protein [Sphaerimonospora thailandensis]|uniref:Uncharacterized protein n=1 Tax=Sphaerimonospora thailandensis TaxID=795644 RepID=A0A8J3R9C0_9ACTN|nr:hypothetical protein [Sphaerimonospora thailandensis]GIH69747.1 hypothetical protein Mth01_20000 [Sphaerimonospora thailandensis]
MGEEKKSPKELAEELATNAQDDPRFKNRTPGIRATRKGSKEQADADIAGRVGGIGTTGGGGPGGTVGEPPTGQVLADTTLGSEDAPSDETGETSGLAGRREPGGPGEPRRGQ